MTAMRMIVAALALVALANALPVMEDDWDANDALLQRLYKDSTPLTTLMQADPSTEAAAKAKADENKAAQDAAQKTEDEATAEEATNNKAAADAKAEQDKISEKAAADAKAEQDKI